MRTDQDNIAKDLIASIRVYLCPSVAERGRPGYCFFVALA